MKPRFAVPGPCVGPHFTRCLALLACISLMGISICKAQDMVYNGSFEDGDLPFEWAQFRYATNWHSQGVLYTPDSDDVWGHSPDYFDDQTPFAPVFDPNVGMRAGVAPTGVTAHTGHRFAGLDDYELIQQKYGNNMLQERRFYTVSLFIRPSSYFFAGTSNLRIFLANNEFQYQNSNNSASLCTPPYMSYNEPSHVQELASIPIDLATYPANLWSRVSATFYVSEELNETFKWLVIDMNSGGNAQACGMHYIFVDDVSFVRAEYCASVCAPDLPSPSNGTVQNVMVADAFCPGAPYCADCINRYPYSCNIENDWECMPQYYNDNCCCPIKFFEMWIADAVGVNFWVRSRWGAQDIVYERHEFDANGLKFPGQSYFVLQWMGRDGNGQHLPAGVYDYELEYWNCTPGSEHSIESSLYYEAGDEYYAQPPEVVNGLLENCCPNHLYFQNYTFSGLVEEHASTFITAGSNVTSGAVGPVVVPSTSNVTFRAGEAINLEPGFMVEAGAVFNAVITDCVYGGLKSMAYRPEFQLSGMSGWGKPVEESISLYPNPTTGRFTVRMPESEPQGKIRVLDPAGKLVRIFQVRSRYDALDMAGLARGIYFLEIYGSNGFLQSFRLAYE